MFLLDKFISNALHEDIGSGDITTDYLIEDDLFGNGIIVSRDRIILAGSDIVRRVFTMLDPDVVFSTQYVDGDKIEKDEVIFQISGRFSALLKGERTALNFLQRLSGIATRTRKFVDEVKGLKIKLVDTRKTIPGWRVLEKYAVRVGGARNHRMGLYDGVLIKDNHIAICGGVFRAVERIKKKISHLVKVEVEVSSLSEVQDAIVAGVDVIMLDNMEVNKIEEAVKIIGSKALVEISGGVTLNKLRRLAATGADIISIGSLTHSAVAVDISMRIISP